MMNTPIRTIMDSTIKKDFNKNYIDCKLKNDLLKDQEFKNKNRFLGVDKTKILKPEIKNSRTRINHFKVRIDPFLSVMDFLRFSGYEHLGFYAKD